MAKGHKPVSGSRAYWPRKKAKSIYATFRSYPELEDALPLGFAGYKAGMTQLIVSGTGKFSEVVVPATVLECPPLVVCGIVLYKKSHDGLNTETVVWADNISKDLERKTKTPKKTETSKKLEEIEKKLDEFEDIRLLVHTQPRETGIGKKKPELFELELGSELKEKWEYAKQKLGGTISVKDVFKEGEYVDVKAVTQGKGFEGPVKRFGVKIRPRKHEKKRRHVGNLGPRNVARVLPGKIAMPGQHGFQTRTEYNKKILKIDTGELTPKGGWLNYGEVKGDYLIIHGSVPGPKKRLVMLRKGVRAPEPQPVEVKKVLLHSQQGV